MAPFSLEFSFSQRFAFPASEVYAWATDYQPSDLVLAGKRGTRRLRAIGEDTLLLSDTLLGADGTAVRKPKLVQRYPAKLRWINTHVGGPNRHSQFLYEVVPEGARASRLEFSARVLRRGPAPTPAEKKRLTAEARADAVEMWRHLAAQMKRQRQG